MPIKYTNNTIDNLLFGQNREKVFFCLRLLERDVSDE